MTRVLRRPKSPWVNDLIKAQMKERDELQFSLKKNRSNYILGQQYREKKNFVKTLLEISKKDHHREEFIKCKKDVSRKWKILDRMTPKTNKDLPQLPDKNEKEKAEEFNSFFASVGKKAFDKSQENVIDHDNFISNLKSNYNENTRFKLHPST